MVYIKVAARENTEVSSVLLVGFYFYIIYAYISLVFDIFL